MKSLYKVEEMKYSDLEDSVLVPTYQRRLVWSEKQKEDFIENISKGYPFGSILIYRYEGDTKLSLIDGLQRFSTMKEYKSNPAKYFNDLSPYISRLLADIEEGMDITLSDEQRRDLSEKTEMLLKQVLEDPNPDIFCLRDLMRDKVSLYPTDIKYQEKLTRLQKELIEDASNYLNLDELTIPCVTFTGHESQLPDVFANLNQGGTKLSKYQVLAAHWTKHDITMPDTDIGNKIVEKVVDRYTRMEESRDLVIEGFDQDEMRQSRIINLSEYCCALGELITRAVPVFWGSVANAENDKSEDTYNVVGYLSTAIALGVDNRSINCLPEKIDLFQSESFANRLTAYILDEYSVIQSEFGKWLRKPGTNTAYESGAITDMQVLSFFAALWHKHYEINEAKREINIIEHYKQNGYEDTRKNLVRYSICDAVARAWMGSGDTRLANYYVKGSDAPNSYLLPIDRDAMQSKLLAWFDDMKQRGSVNIEKVSRMLLCVYSAPKATRYTADKYDIEHVIAKKRLKQNSIYKVGQIPGGTLGNLMFLNAKTNRGKKEYNLYYLHNHFEGVTIDVDYLGMICYPAEETIVRAEQQLQQGNAVEANKLIEMRTKDMIASISKEVCG